MRAELNRKRVLVFSNNCFSKSNSNGRTLGNLFHGWPKQYLAQFCVIAKDPNWELCDNYYCLEDKILFQSFLHGRKAKGRLLKQGSISYKSNDELSGDDTKRKNLGNKTLEKVLLREMVWSNQRWNSKHFQNWLDSFLPDIIVLQVGDTLFMMDIALYVARKYRIPLFIYNTEGYYFFPRNWYYPSLFDSILFPLYRKKYQRKFRDLMRVATHSVYLNDKLKEDYDREFAKPSSVIYNSSEISEITKKTFAEEGTPRFSYLGNLGLDRDSALIEVGEVLSSINHDFHLDIYGTADDLMKEKFRKSKGIIYHGHVSYDKVKEIIANSDVLFHVESTKGYQSRQLQYAFSGKIADSISSGKCFVLYAPKELACSKYIFETEAGWYAESKGDLQKILTEIIYDPEKRDSVLKLASKISKKNHQLDENARCFQQLFYQ